MAGQLTIRWIENDVNKFLNNLLKQKMYLMLLRLILTQYILD